MSESLKQLLSPYLEKSKPSGNENVLAICPFHRKPDGSKERNPSFSMNVYNGLWHCFSCHAGGNLYTFLRDVGVSRHEIDRDYKDHIEQARSRGPKTVEYAELEEPTDDPPLPESFLGLFDYCPTVLTDDGFPPELLRSFDVGFDLKHLRITFPLRDHEGRLVGISGRALEDINPRYKVYDTEYLDFGMPKRHLKKGALIWNLHAVLARWSFIAHKDRYLIVTEGYKATMRVVQAGLPNTGALMGSSVTHQQKRLLSRLGCPIYLMFDNDIPGREGQASVGRKLCNSSLLRVMSYDAQQPSDLSLQEIQEAFNQATPFAQWYVS
jgi:DNA primase